MSLCVCPICGAEKSFLVKHVVMSHKIKKEDFLKQYPGIKTVSEEVSRKISDANRRNWDTNDKYRERCSSYWRSSSHGKEVHDRLIKKWEDDPKKQHDALQEGVQKNLSRLSKIRSATMRKTSKRLWEDESYINNRRESGRKQMLKNMKNPSYHRASRCLYNGISYRSSWEVALATVLDEYDIKFSYETFKFPYQMNNITHLYIPDFYLPDYNYIIEVKPLNLIDDPDVVLKKECVPSKYNYSFMVTPIHNDIIETLTKLGILQ